MVAALVRLHSGDALWQYATISPVDVPVFGFVVCRVVVPTIRILDLPILKRQLEIKQALRHESYHIVLGITDIEDKSLLVFEATILVVIFNPDGLREHLLLSVVTFLFLFLACVRCADGGDRRAEGSVVVRRYRVVSLRRLTALQLLALSWIALVFLRLCIV